MTKKKIQCKYCNDTQWIPDKWDYDGDHQYPCHHCRTEECMTCLDTGTYYHRGNGYGSGHGIRVCRCPAGVAHTEEKENKKDLAEFSRLKKKLDKRARELAKRDIGAGI